MIKYTGYAVTFAEIPDEITLCITISNCGGHCAECHSPYLRKDIGDDLEDDIRYLLAMYKDRISCVCFMGQGNDPAALKRCFDRVKSIGKKAALYTGKTKKSYLKWQMYFPCLWDYLKVGEYQADKGGLDSPTTNQRMFRRKEDGEIEDITYMFQRR